MPVQHPLYTNAMFQQYDANNDGNLTSQEFATMVNAVPSRTATELVHFFYERKCRAVVANGRPTVFNARPIVFTSQCRGPPGSAAAAANGGSGDAAARVANALVAQEQERASIDRLVAELQIAPVHAPDAGVGHAFIKPPSVAPFALSL